jgi:hypothetical protein
MGRHRAVATQRRRPWDGITWQPPGRLFEHGREFDSDRWGDAILAAVVVLFALLGIGALVARFITIW